MANYNIVTTEDLERLKSELIHEIRALKSDTKSAKYLKSKEVRKLLGISAGKLQSMRDSKILPFTPIGGVFYYNEKDVYDLLEQNKVK